MVRVPRVAFFAHRVSASNKLRILITLITSATYTIQPTPFALHRSRNAAFFFSRRFAHLNLTLQRFHHPKFIPLARSSSRQMSPLTKSSPQSLPLSQPSRRARHSLDSSPGDHPKLKLIPPRLFSSRQAPSTSSRRCRRTPPRSGTCRTWSGEASPGISS